MEWEESIRETHITVYILSGLHLEKFVKMGGGHNQLLPTKGGGGGGGDNHLPK